MDLIHVLVFTDEYTEEEIQNTAWTDMAWGDYIEHRLYDKNTKTILLSGDNCHLPIEIMIDYFIEGVRYTGTKVSCEMGVLLIESTLAEAKYFKKYVIED